MIDEKFLLEISGSLPLFKKVDKNYNCRCIICGDSKKNKYRARGYFIAAEDTFVYYCHNCMAGNNGINFAHFLKQYFPEVHKRYIIARFTSKKHEKVDTTKFSQAYLPQEHKIFEGLEKNNPFAKKYLHDRYIYDTKGLYYTDNFQEWVNTIIPGKFKSPKPDKRIVIPLIGKNNEVYGFQGRSLGNDTIKYITILFEGCPKIYGLDKVNMNHPYYVVEGPLDSMFLGNSIAACGGDLVSQLQKIDHIEDNAVFVFDNDCRNPDIVKSMYRAVDAGYKIVVWPTNIFSHMDINDIIKDRIRNNSTGLEEAKSYIEDTLKNNTHQGLAAKFLIKKWAKTK